MNLNEKGQEVYNRLIADLQARKGYHEATVELLKMYVFNLQEAGKLAEEIEKEGSTLEHVNKSGFKNLVSNPKARMYALYSSQALKLAKILSLNSRNDQKEQRKKKGFDTGMKVA